MSEVDESRGVALERLRRAKAVLAQAQAQYEQALVHCADVGLGNTKIARTVGVTETAIRAFLKRRGYERSSDAMRRRVAEES